MSALRRSLDNCRRHLEMNVLLYVYWNMIIYIFLGQPLALSRNCYSAARALEYQHFRSLGMAVAANLGAWYKPAGIMTNSMTNKRFLTSVPQITTRQSDEKQPPRPRICNRKLPKYCISLHKSTCRSWRSWLKIDLAGTTSTKTIVKHHAKQHVTSCGNDCPKRRVAGRLMKY